LLLGSLLLGLALRGLLLGSLLVALPPRLDRVDQAARGTGPHAEHGQTCAGAVLPGRPHGARAGPADDGLRAVARHPVGRVHARERLPDSASAFCTSATSSRVRLSYSIETIEVFTIARPRSVDQR